MSPVYSPMASYSQVPVFRDSVPQPPTMTEKFNMKLFQSAGDSSDNSPIKYDERGPIRLADGSVYTGQWNGQQRHGYGRIEWEDGTSYEGQWVNDYASGHGTLIHASGDKYTGQWAHGMANGQG